MWISIFQILCNQLAHFPQIVRIHSISVMPFSVLWPNWLNVPGQLANNQVKVTLYNMTFLKASVLFMFFNFCNYILNKNRLRKKSPPRRSMADRTSSSRYGRKHMGAADFTVWYSWEAGIWMLTFSSLFPFYFRGSQPMRWCYPHSVWVSFPQLSVSGNFLKNGTPCIS